MIEPEDFARNPPFFAVRVAAAIAVVTLFARVPFVQKVNGATAAMLVILSAAAVCFVGWTLRELTVKFDSEGFTPPFSGTVPWRDVRAVSVNHEVLLLEAEGAGRVRRYRYPMRQFRNTQRTLAAIRAAVGETAFATPVQRAVDWW